jgi:hypothetical protein
MRCPACGHEGAGLPLRCKECGRTYPRPILEEYDRITFLLDELEDWNRQHLIPQALHQELEQRYRKQLREVAEEMGLRPEAAVPAALAAPPPPFVSAVSAPSPTTVGPPGRFPERALPAQEQPAAPVPVSIPRPHVDWGTIWQALLSPRTFEALLYVGAFLIIAAAGTLVYFNWGRFSPPLQLLSLAGGTAVFFAAGWLVRTRWHLEQSGVALIGIGALIIPVDFYAWERLRALPPETYPLMWLAASAFCAVTYAAITWWIRHRFFLVITLLAAHSFLLALLRLAGVPLAWWGAPTVMLAAGWLARAPAMQHIDASLPPAAEGVSLAAAVVGIAAPTLSFLEPLADIARGSTTPGPWILAIAVAWWAGGGFFSLAAQRDPRTVTAYAAGGTVPIAVVLTLLPFVPRAWVSLGLVALTPMYVLAAERQIGPLGRAARDVGLILPVVGLVWAWLDVRSVALTYVAAGALYLWWALRQSGRPVMAAGAQILLLVGLLALSAVAKVAVTARSLAVLAASAIGIGLAAALHQVPAVTEYLYIGAYAEAVVAVVASQLASPIIRLIAAGSSLAIAIYSAIRVHRGADAALRRITTTTLWDGELVFHWSAAILAATTLTLAWALWRPDLRGLPVAGLALASLFLETGQRLGKVRTSYAQPWTVSGIVLSAVVVVLTGFLPHHAEVVLTLLVGVATYAVWAWRLRAPVFAHAAAWLLLVPFALLLPEARARGLLPGREAYALAFAALAAAYLALGAVLDRRAERFAVPWHAISQFLMPLALLWALQREDVARWTLAAAVVFYAISAWRIHRQHHPTFLRFLAWVSGVAPSMRSLGAGFVAAAAWLFPFWYHLTLRHVPWLGGEQARLGVAAAILSWGYLAAGRWLGRVDATYATPLWSAAQALAVVGGLLAVDRRPLLIIAVTLGTILQFGFYRLTRAPIWIYTAALGGTGLVGIVLHHLEVPGVTAGFVMLGVAAAYLGVGAWLWSSRDARAIPAAVAALYAVAFLDAAVGLLLASFGSPLIAGVAYVLGAAIFLWTGWRLGEPLFSYAVAGLLAASYVMGLAAWFSVQQTPEPRYGIWLSPGIVAFLATARLLERSRATEYRPRWAAWAGPFYIAAHVGTAVMIVLSAALPVVFPLALAAGAIVYGVSAVIFRSPVWLYPALLTAHLAFFFELLRMGLPPQAIPAAFVPVTMLLAAIAHRSESRGTSPAGAAWARPWYQIAFADLALWELVGVIAEPTHIITSAGFAALAGTFAQLWRAPQAAALALGLALVGALQLVRWLHVAYPSALLLFSIASLLLGGSAVALAQLRRGLLWQPGARMLAIAVSIITVGVAIWGVAVGIHPGAGAGLVYVLAIVGLLYLLLGIADRREWLGYLAIAMLETAWAIFLLKGLEVREVQLYAIPGALYLLGVGVVERRLGHRSFAFVVDLAGLTLLLGSALWQSVGPNGFRYAVLLSVEALLVAWFGATQRLRRHFFGGLGVLLVNVVIQAIDPLRALDKTVLFLSLGIVLVVTAVLAERKRDTIIRTTGEWRTRLETWE